MIFALVLDELLDNFFCSPIPFEFHKKWMLVSRLVGDGSSAAHQNIVGDSSGTHDFE